MNHITENRQNSGKKKRKGIAALLALTFGLCVTALTVRAEEKQAPGSTPPAAELSEYTISWEGVSSRGSLVYQQEEKTAQIYAADFLFLKDRLGAIPDTVFDPSCYTHTHQWEYINISRDTHTRCCSLCGNTFDLVSAHKTELHESCSLHHEGSEYPGIRYTCVCGYQWEREEAHTPCFKAVDAASHKNECRLNGTEFCPGYEPITEEHYAYRYNPCKDGRRHERICMDCGYQSEEACCFTLLDADNDGESASETGSENCRGGRRCWCGNMETSNAETGEAAETPNSNVESENPEAEAEPENPKAETEPENPNTEAKPENPEAETELENPNTEAKPENPEAETELENPKMMTESENPKAEAGPENLKTKVEDQNMPADETETENGNTEQGGRYEE